MKKTLLLLLFLLTAMQPNLFAQKVTLTTSKTTIAENESATVTATLDVPTDKDVTISLASTGTATLSQDFITNSAVVITTAAGGNGSGSNANQLSSPNSFFVDNAGNIYVVDSMNNRIQKWAPGAITGTTVVGGNGIGSNANQLSSPSNLFVDTTGNIYVADSQNYRIQKWAPGATTGITVAGGNGAGSNANQLSYPNYFTVDATGNTYVADGMNSRVQKWASGAVTGTTVAGGNGSGSNANQLSYPNYFTVDATGNIYVADGGMNNRIQKWAPGAITGTTVAGGNGSGSNANQFNSVNNFFVDSVGNIYITDSGNNRIQKWAPAAITGTTVAGGNGMGSNANQLSSPNNLFVDTTGNIYIADGQNYRIQKWSSGAITGTTVAGGNGSGSNANQLSYPNNFTVDATGNIYVADGMNNRIQKYKYSPQIIIPAGQTSAQLIVSGIVDTEDEYDETIVLEPGITNATLVSTEPIRITLTDNNDFPTVTFTFSKDKIVENSPTDVTLTAILSNVSGKNIDLGFLMEGTATEMLEYTVSSKSISIPAKSPSGSITISTKGLDDTLVEMLETIIFKISTITNATATVNTATLYLESDDNPTITSIVASKTTIAENESTTITATLDQASSKDVVLPILLSGTAGLNVDYTSSFSSKGEESLMATIQGYSSSYVQLSDGRYVFTNGNSLKIYDPITKTQTTQSLQNYPYRLKVAGNIVYYLSMNSKSILKIDLSHSTPAEESVVTINEQDYSSLSAFDVVGSKVYYAVANNATIPYTRKIYSKTGVTSAVFLYEPTVSVSFLSVDSSGFIYISDSYSIQRIDTQNNVVTNISSIAGGLYISNISNVKLFKDQLYVNASESNIAKIKKFNAANNSFETVDYATTNTKQIVDFSISSDGNLQLLRQDTNQVLLYNYQLAPQLKILAGSTTATITLTGIDDTTDEADETIVLTPGRASNASLSSNASITVTITDNDELPSISFALSASKIVENSATTVTLTATPSVISGKDITIPFTLSGTATPTTEYTVSANQIVIPANAPSANVTISTKGLDDTIVEILETINFNIGTLVNATTSSTLITLLLESDDNPTITSIVASKTTIAEHESTILTATLDSPASKDVTISLESTGTAVYDQDFKTNSAIVISTVAGGNGIGSNANQLSYPRNISIDASANIYVSNNNKIQKWAPGANEGTTVLTIPTGTYVDFIFVDSNGNVFLLDRMASRIEKWVPGATSGVIVSGGNGSGANANQLSNPTSFFVDTIGNIYVVDGMNNRIQKWAPGTATGVTVAGGNGSGSAENQLNNPRAVFVDKVGNVYVNDTNNNRIQKWVPNSQTGITVLGSVMGAGEYVYLGQNIEGLFVDVTEKIFLMSTEYTNTGQVKHIKKWDPVTKKSEVLAGNNGSGSAANQLNNPQSFSFDTKGNLYIADTENNRIQKHQFAPQIVIKAGQTTAQLIVSGVEDELENEGTELIVLKQTLVQNATLNSQTDITISLLDNTRTLTLQENSPFTGLENGAVAWGDYDRDGDQDVAVMGTGNSGAVTKLYENRNGVFIDTNQNFAKLYGGDISWVDLNKDGWIDLVVSGFNATPQTKVYINDKGTSFNPSTEFGLPQLYSSKMAWGDLDNDGDIDLAISGIDKDEKYVFNILYKEDNQNRFVIEPKTSAAVNNYMPGNYQGFIKGDLKIVDVDLDGDNDIIYNGENYSGQPISNTIYNSYIKTGIPYNYNNNQSTSLKNSVIEVAKMNASQSNLTVLSSGMDSNGANQFYSSLPLSGNMLFGVSQYPKLKNGDIAVADYNNDGTNDILFTGEDSAGIPTTKLYFQNTDGNYKESPIVLEGLRNSTANWVDYDMDGDLDLFLTGTSATGGAKSLLYVSNIANKKNVAPPAVSGLIAEDLGNGKIKFKWSAPKDDYSTNLGYVIKLGTTPGGTELSNTESNLTTGTRLITKPAAIYTGFYEMQLNPGKYYWSVQAVDTGLKGGAFSAEDSFTLTYDWKILNQGGIIDRSISGIEAPVIKLADLDNDNDLDLIYANANGSGSQILRFDGKRLLADTNVSNINSFLYTINYINNINSLAVGDINGDGTADVVRNDLNSTNNLVLNLSNGTDYTSTALGGGLFKSKIKIVDMNNDGQPDIVVLGMSTNTISGLPKLWIYEYDKSTNPPSFKKTDASAQIAPLANASFDLGDIDKDQDIDLIITGFSASDGLKCIIYENVTELAGSFTLKATDNNLVAIKDGTTDFIDFDGDGDLDAVFTGTSVTNDIFEIYINRLNEGFTTWPRFSSGLEPMRQSKISLGDFNGDGYSDLLYSGITGGGAGNVTKLSEYNPSTSKYTDSAFDVSDIQNAEVVFGDIDGDNDLDFVIVGKNKNYNSTDPNNINGISTPFIFRTYINVRNDSAKVLASSGKQSATKKTFSPKAATYTINEKPSVPALPSTPVKFLNNVNSKAGTYPVELSWLAASDDHTPPAGLTYALKIGTTPGAENIMGANANTSGKRKVSEKGNVEHNKKWRLSLPVGTYYWSVQAIDASYSGSEFSVSNQFEITAKGLSTESFNNDILVAAFPNPTNDIVTVIIPEEYVLEKIEMYNSLGQFVGQYSKSTISLQNLAAGNYFLKIYTSGGITTKKIIRL